MSLLVNAPNYTYLDALSKREVILKNCLGVRIFQPGLLNSKKFQFYNGELLTFHFVKLSSQIENRSLSITGIGAVESLK